jgi:hypothetical protein
MKNKLRTEVKPFSIFRTLFNYLFSWTKTLRSFLPLCLGCRLSTKSKRRATHPPGISDDNAKILTKVKRRAYYLNMSLIDCCGELVETGLKGCG